MELDKTIWYGVDDTLPYQVNLGIKCEVSDKVLVNVRDNIKNNIWEVVKLSVRDKIS